MLDERKAAILRAVVTEHIETAAPVGSSHVVNSPGIDVSGATVRHEMAALEQEGYLVQPHTSAGRVPTDLGYRFFVDHLVRPPVLLPAHRQQVRDFFGRAHGELEELLGATSRLLSRLTDYAAVVVRPAHEGAVVRSVQLVSLGPRLVLVVAVLSNGVVEKRTVELAEEIGDERVGAASACLARCLVGHPLTVSPAPDSTGDPVSDGLISSALSALDRPDDDQHVFVGGASRMAAAFDAVETVRSVLSILEQQYVVVTLLKDVLDRGLTVAIGAENGVTSLAECAVVVAPYEVEGEESGSIGVLGPTRMNYPQALAAVAVVGQRLGRHLSELSRAGERLL